MSLEERILQPSLRSYKSDSYESESFESESYKVPANESMRHFETQNYIDDIHFVNRLLSQLIRTVDINKLLTIYFENIKQALPLKGISLGSEDISLSQGDWKSHTQFHIDCELRLDVSPLLCDVSDGRTAIRYRFNRKLTINEKELLTVLHETVSHPVVHALSFTRLARLATKDSLTGLCNRNAFDEDIDLMRVAASRKQSSFGLLIIDLDAFKQVNDQFGHDEGDKVLVSFSSVLADSLRANERAYRFGGDEFCCLIDTSTGDTVSLVAKRIIENAAKTHLLSRHGVTASIGGTLYRQAESNESMFKRADRALYHVKQQGKHGYLLA